MNNAAISNFQEEPKETARFEERSGVLGRELEALRALETSESWSTLKELVFDGRVSSLESQLSTESKKKEVNLPELYRLQGRLAEATRTANLYKTVLAEHQGIKKQLNPLRPGNGPDTYAS